VDGEREAEEEEEDGTRVLDPLARFASPPASAAAAVPLALEEGGSFLFEPAAKPAPGAESAFVSGADAGADDAVAAAAGVEVAAADAAAAAA
jgi:hypothetical protein